MCDCDYPMCTRMCDVVISKKPKKNGLITVDRHLDCLFCGPHIERTEIIPSYNEQGQLKRFIGGECYHKTND